MSAVFSVKFWGVRGVLPVSGPDFNQVGGQTCCVEVRCGPERILLDGGTGIRSAGRSAGEPHARVFRVFLSHFHADHVQGIPYFEPLHHRAARVDFFGPDGGREQLAASFENQEGHPALRGGLDRVAATVVYNSVNEGQSVSCGDAVVTAVGLNHPGGAMGYRVDFGGHAVVYATDTEHFSCPDPKLVRMAGQADLLIYDATFTPEEYAGTGSGPPRTGLGHSTFEHGIEVARAAGVRHLSLFHHHPDRTDPEVADLAARAGRLFPECTAARRGMTVELL